MKTILDQLRDIESLPPPPGTSSAMPDSGGGGRGRVWIVILIFLIGLVVLLFLLFRSSSNEKEGSKTNVISTVTTTKTSDSSGEIEFLGYVDGRVFFSFNGSTCSYPVRLPDFVYGVPKQSADALRSQLADYIPFTADNSTDDTSRRSGRRSDDRRESRYDRSITDNRRIPDAGPGPSIGRDSSHYPVTNSERYHH